ncbi:MAG: hypothetical protein ACRDZX_07230 [Acidimicrobiales bacterium]
MRGPARLLGWKVSGLAEVAAAHPRPGWRRRGGRRVALGVVLAGWVPASAEASARILSHCLARLPGVEHHVVVVANNAEVLERLGGRAPGGFPVVAGSNEEGEFSAYEEGRRYLSEQFGADLSAWMVLNDRLPAYGTAYLDTLSPGLLALAGTTALAAGHFDSRGRPLQFGQYRVPCWLRSNWLLLSGALAAPLGSLCPLKAADFDGLVPPCPPEVGPGGEWLGVPGGEVLGPWLTRPGGWEKAEALSRESWPRLRFKALAIMNEWALSARLGEAGAALVPWRQARALSQLEPGHHFTGEVLALYREQPAFGLGLDMSPTGRAQLAMAVLAHRAGAWRAAEAFAGAAARSARGWLEQAGPA